MPKYRRHQYIIKFIVTVFNLFIFNYLIIYADKFQVALEPFPVKANFVDMSLADKEESVAVRLDNVIIDDSVGGGNITYVIKPWDTLEEIAQNIWTTIANIRRINSLWNDAQVRGNGTIVNKDWIAINKLTISDLPGIVVAMTSRTSVAEFAKQYNLNEDDIKALNNISDSKSILQEWDELFLTISEQDAIKKWILEDPNPEPVLLAVEQPKPTEQKPTNKPAKEDKPVQPAKQETKPAKKPTAQIVSAWGPAGWTNGIIWYDKGSILATWFQKDRWNYWFAAWYCTSYAASKRPDIFGNPDLRFRWNAGAWYANAQKAWNAVWKSPRVWAIAVFAPWRGASGYGHVWYVEQIDGDNIILTDMNYKWRNIVTRRVVDKDLAMGYIY